jgi:hypothetical protein
MINLHKEVQHSHEEVQAEGPFVTGPSFSETFTRWRPGLRENVSSRLEQRTAGF